MRSGGWQWASLRRASDPSRRRLQLPAWKESLLHVRGQGQYEEGPQKALRLEKPRARPARGVAVGDLRHRITPKGGETVFRVRLSNKLTRVVGREAKVQIFRKAEQQGRHRWKKGRPAPSLSRLPPLVPWLAPGSSQGAFRLVLLLLLGCPIPRPRARSVARAATRPFLCVRVNSAGSVQAHLPAAGVHKSTQQSPKNSPLNYGGFRQSSIASLFALMARGARARARANRGTTAAAARGCAKQKESPLKLGGRRAFATVSQVGAQSWRVG